LGVAAGVSNLVPFIGPFIAGVLGVLVALFTDGVGLAILVVVVMVVVQQGDSQLVSPLVMGKTVRLHPLVVLLALLVAGTLYGIFGLLVAVPLVAGANVLLSHLWRTRVPWAGEDEPAPPRRPRGRRARRRAAADARAAPAPSPPSEETGATDGPPPTAAEPPRSAPRPRR
ncbi:MAG: AI-2E family transporter, partial [Egibacteraceae bacterium]